MEKISNHYVPQFYLKNFSINRKSIGMYNLQHSKYVKKASIRKQACIDYLYGDDGTVENLLMEIEGISSQIINNIIKTRKTPDIQSLDYAMLVIFILLSEARNLKTAESINNLVDAKMKAAAKMSKDPNFTEDIIDNTKIALNIPNLYSIQATFTIFQILLDLKCTLIINLSDRQFITSDNPLLKYNQFYVMRKYANRGYGLGNMGMQLFFPISPQICICIFDHVLYEYNANKEGNIEISNGIVIDDINRLLYLNTYKTMFFNENVNESYIKRLVKKRKNINATIGNEVAIFGSDNNKLMVYSPNKVYQSMKFPIFRIKQEFSNMSLPLHMGGPMRPYASKIIDEIERNKK